MDGVFDLFHGHLEAIQNCRSLAGPKGRVIIGITGDDDAADYKRRPVISEEDRSVIVAALRDVDHVVCPCPLVVSESFMNENCIDLVVHGFADVDLRDDRILCLSNALVNSDDSILY